MIESTRLLGFAFAGADLLFEIDAAGTILFVTGATSGFSHQRELCGSNAAELFLAKESSRFTIIARGLAPGDRVGPLPMRLASGDKAMLSLCYLPQNDRISCTLVRPGKRGGLAANKVDSETGLFGPEEFLSAAAARVGAESSVALVNVPELPGICAQLSPDDADSLMTAIGDNVRAMDASAAARLSKSGFGVVSERADAAKTLAGCIQEPVRERGMEPLQVEEVLLSLKAGALSPEQNILALRYVIGAFAEGKLKSAPGAVLADIFEQMLNETIARAQAFGATVAEGAFDLVFEPIVELRSGVTVHYEALTRFHPGQSPAETIQFAEDLGLANSFDLALIAKAFRILEQSPARAASLAINVSGRSFSTPSSFAMLAGIFYKKRALAKRVLIEITETAALTDLVAANESIQSLRRMGYRVGIDDFGAGAASLKYLHDLNVNFVKVDGSLIQALGKSQRKDALLRGVLKSCADSNIETIAEWIDSPDKLKRCIEIGFRLGQGRFLGGSLKELPRNAA